MRFGKLWIIAGVMALAIAAVGWRMAIAEPTPTGADNSGGVFSTKLGL